MIPIKKEPKELFEKSQVYECCCFCGAETNTWHVETGNTVCPKCAKSHSVSDLPKLYSKEKAIEIAKQFISKVNKLEKQFGMSFNSDRGDIYLSYKSAEADKFWDSIHLGWIGNGSGIKVTEELRIKEKIKEQALAKLSPTEREALGF